MVCSLPLLTKLKLDRQIVLLFPTTMSFDASSLHVICVGTSESPFPLSGENLEAPTYLVEPITRLIDHQRGGTASGFRCQRQRSSLVLNK